MIRIPYGISLDAESGRLIHEKSSGSPASYTWTDLDVGNTVTRAAPELEFSARTVHGADGGSSGNVVTTTLPVSQELARVLHEQYTPGQRAELMRLLQS